MTDTMQSPADEQTKPLEHGQDDRIVAAFLEALKSSPIYAAMDHEYIAEFIQRTNDYFGWLNETKDRRWAADGVFKDWETLAAEVTDPIGYNIRDQFGRAGEHSSKMHGLLMNAASEMIWRGGPIHELDGELADRGYYDKFITDEADMGSKRDA